MADLIDPTKTGNYPVVLSDRLLGRQSDDIFTSVRYNHKPSSIPESSQARLKPSIPGQTSSYDLNVLSSTSPSTTHAFAGTRTSGNGKYVLYFDAENQHFVLDRVDSSFHMNLTRTPETSDPEALARKFPHIDSEGNKKPAARKDTGAAKKKERAKSHVQKEEKREFATKAERRRVKQAGDLALPMGGTTPTPVPAPPKSKPKKKPADEEDEDEDEGDDLLLVEYPDGGGPKSQNRDFSPAFHSVRKFDDFMDQRESEADDADDESLNESDADFKLPSPVNHPVHEPEGEAMDVDDEQEEEEEEDTRGGSDMEGDMEDDLAKDLAEAFGQGDGGSSPAAKVDHGDESEISEED